MSLGHLALFFNFKNNLTGLYLFKEEFNSIDSCLIQTRYLARAVNDLVGHWHSKWCNCIKTRCSLSIEWTGSRLVVHGVCSMIIDHGSCRCWYRVEGCPVGWVCRGHSVGNWRGCTWGLNHVRTGDWGACSIVGRQDCVCLPGWTNSVRKNGSVSHITACLYFISHNSMQEGIKIKELSKSNSCAHNSYRSNSPTLYHKAQCIAVYNCEFEICC